MTACRRLACCLVFVFVLQIFPLAAINQDKPAATSPVQVPQAQAAPTQAPPAQNNPAKSSEGKASLSQDQTLDDQLDPKTRKVMDNAAKKGQQLTVLGAVSDKVDIEAVLLPYEVSHHVFGREVADNYAVVEITVSNHSADQSLIVQTVFIDYSQWALSGSVFLSDKRPTGVTSSHSLNRPNQIASVEYRAVRGDALDAQPWTKRNVTIRALRLAGSLASAFSFVTRDQDIVHGISAFAGQGVPAAETFWPDGTVEQLNRISDLGFKVNKVVPKSASDVIVAFFPLNRFLTPGLKSMFKKSPALFFAPYAMAFDHEARKQLRPMFEDFVGKENAEKFMRALPLVYMCAYESLLGQEPKSDGASEPKLDWKAIEDNSLACLTKTRAVDQSQSAEEVTMVMKFLSHASLNTVRVVVGGDFTVNVNDIPATITGVDVEGGAAAWSTSGPKAITLRGSFLATGSPQILEAKKLNIDDPANVDNTSDSTMKFNLPLKNPLPPGTVLTFKVNKTNNETKKSVEGLPFTFSVPPLPSSAAFDVSNALTKDNILSVVGQNFADTTDQPLKVLLFSDPNKTTADATLAKSDFKQQKSTQIDIDLCTVKGLALDDSTWTVKVQEGNVVSAHSAAFKAPSSAKSKCPPPAAGGAADQPQSAAKAKADAATASAVGGKKQKKNN